MEITSSNNTINITGNIKSVSDYQEIKSKVDSLSQHNSSLIINIENSLSMTSSVIGYFNKLILKDKVNVTMNIGNKQLIELLQDLNLVSTFNVRAL